MDSKKFEEFLHKVAQKLKEKYGDKVAIVMDNASYHTVMVRNRWKLLLVTRIHFRFFFQHDDVPRSDWKLSQFKEFCETKGLEVLPGKGKRAGKLVLEDYKAVAMKYSNETGMKYRADSIMKSYGIRCVRLPPYHPELNPIGKFMIHLL